MRLILLIGSIILISLSNLYAQETIYLANGNRLPGKLTGAEGERVRVTAVRNGKSSTFSSRRENLLVAVAADGRFLVISDLDQDPVKAQQEIDAFNKDEASRRTYDLLLKASPASVIQAQIQYESDEVVNYKALAGGAGSINKRELAAIFYRDGRHKLLMPPAAVVTAVNSVRGELKRLFTPPVTKSVTVANVTKPTPVKPAKGGGKPGVKVPATKSSEPIVKTEVSKPKPEPSVSKPQAVATTTDVKPTLTEAQYQQYRSDALNRVDQFVACLNIITNRELDDTQRDKAIDQALGWFMPDATVEVSSTKRPGVRKLKIGDYLRKLKLLPYASTAIEWTEVQYVSELTQATDGNYYGLIKGQQTFTGYSENGQDVMYSDVTEKSIKVKLESYTKSDESEVTGKEVKWRVLLGNIGLIDK